MSPTVFAVVCAFIFGLNIGSFLNVVIWRLPRGGSIAQPTWSYCPKCEHRLGTLDLVPVFSFLLLGRKCRYCREPISWRYPAIETLTALIFMAVAYCFGWSLDTVFYCLFAAALVCVFFIDLEHFIIPDGLNLTIAVIGFVHNGVAIATGQRGQFTVIHGHSVPASVIGFAVYAALIYTVGLLGYVFLVSFADRRKNPFVAGWEYVADNVLDWWEIGIFYVSRVIPPLRRYAVEPVPLEGFTAQEIEEDEDSGAMGGGDGKLAAGIGANLYWLLSLQSFLIAIFLGALIGSVIKLRLGRKFGDRTSIPFGPHMALGAMISLLFGMYLAAGYGAYVRWARGASTTQVAPISAPSTPGSTTSGGAVSPSGGQ